MAVEDALDVVLAERACEQSARPAGDRIPARVNGVVPG